MPIRFGDFNYWITRFYVGEMTISVCFIIGFIILSIYLKYKQDENNFWKIFLFASICWIVAELVMQVTGNRTWVSPPTVFGLPISFPITSIIQGIVEGGIPTVFGYFCAVLLKNKRYSSLAIFMGDSLLFFLRAFQFFYC